MGRRLDARVSNGRHGDEATARALSVDGLHGCHSRYQDRQRQNAISDHRAPPVPACPPACPTKRTRSGNAGIVGPAPRPVNQLQKWGKDLALHPTGTGPFKFVEWVKGDRVVLEKNDGYWGGRPLLDRVTVKTVKEDAARVLMLESGDTDLILNIPPEDIPRLRKDARFAVESIATARALYIMINLKKKPFDDVRVRQALNHAINREAIVKSLFQNNAQAISGIVAPLQNGYAKLPGYGYDPKKAKELLAQAGVPALKVKLWSPKGRYVKDFELAQAVQQDLSAVGVEAALSTMEWGAYLTATKTGPEQTDRE